MATGDNNGLDKALEHVDSNKRAFLKALVVGTAFGAPLVMSFSMKGVSAYNVHAQAASNTTIINPPG
jgi:hypothetical protein